jgi:hypothetical protein
VRIISTNLCKQIAFSVNNISGIVFSVGSMALNLKEMKRVSVVLSLSLIGLMVMGAEHRGSAPAKSVTKVAKKACIGYTIIEASKGIDCNGDTIKLVRTAGFYERVRNDDPS